MQINYEILELFPTSVYATTLPVQYAKVIKFFDGQDMGTDSDHDNYGFRSKDSYLLDKPECAALAEFILGNVKVYAEKLGYAYNEYRFGQSWVSIKAPGQHHTAHTHPNSLLSGVLYYGHAAEKTSAIKFHRTAGGVNASYISPKLVKDKKDLRYAQQEFAITFEPGLLLLFPSHLMHSVPLNKTDKPRCSLAFNVVPKVGFGEEESLTELLF